jgi:CheY-like chemotaxis protein
MSQYNDLKNKRILVVEDVEMNQYLAKHIMESWGCVVEVAENGSVAVERVSDDYFDLVLMDIQMPVMDGIEATRIIRSLEDEHKSATPIVALTANSMKAECENYLRAGMNDWLGKPFQEPVLFATISKNIRKEQLVNLNITKPAAKRKQAIEQKKLYDLSIVEAISGGDKLFIQRMLLLFLETVPNTLTDMKNAADRADWLMLSKQAHKLKSTIDSMCIVSLKQAVREVETGGKRGDDPGVLLPKVKTILETMEKVIEQVKEVTREQ